MQGATPKDGPSAGISICTAYLSLLLNKPIPLNFGMTGELSLQGDVHKIGGLQGKITGCKSLDITTLILPYGNMGEYYELPQQLRNGLTVNFVKHYDEIYKLLFEDNSPREIQRPIIEMANGSI